ncbi:MAG: D-alanyl-D-alanine carboxypeptidase/D-alanyl-D-alanine-endopeptidase [Nitriliruptorales bacterium]|nr:D-alanyl-D-alanine carboxypeptidase/D-alanyl-D-alanine-endopeptidase [Nitriliruptorales bacterium]
MRFRGLLLVASLLVAGVAATLVVVERPDRAQPVATVRAPASELEAVPSAPPASPEPAAPEPPPRDHGELRQRLLAIVDRPDLEVASPLGIAVLDERGDEVLAVDADQAMLPASTNKLLTAAGAMLALGPEHTFQTRVVADGPISDRGTVVGDLTLVGSGDPSLSTDDYHRWIYPARPWTSLDALADDLVAAGLRRVIGSVVGDGTTFQGPTDASGWKDEYLQDLNARHVTGLTVDAGLRWWIDTPPPDVALEIHRADDPVLEAAMALERLLEARGVHVTGRPEAAVEPTTASNVLAAVESPPLSQILTHTLQRSDNHMADMLLPSLGLVGRGRGTWVDGSLALREILRQADVDLTGLLVDDGSGLSRNNRVTSRQLAAIDAHLAASYGETWSSMLAVLGETGTLRGRLRGTIAEGRFAGKTGTLDDVVAVVGHVTGSDGERYHLAVMGNDLRGGDRWKTYVLMDELILALVAHLDGCRLVAPSPAPSPSEPYRSATSC